MANRRHVVPNPEGGWDVRKPNAERASSHHNTQAEVARAKEILNRPGVGFAFRRETGGAPPAQLRQSTRHGCGGDAAL